jgi:hypothetical protein
MLALLPALIGLIPEIAKWIGGDSSGAVAQQVVNVATQVLGTADPAIAQTMLADQQKVSDLRIQLAKIGAEQEKARDDAITARLTAQLSDVASARKQTVDLANAKSAVQWGAPIVSSTVVLTFGAALYAVLTRALPPGSETIANVMLGTLGAMTTAVVSYWVGSSSGSDTKTQMIYASTPTPAGGAAPRPLS